MIRTNETKVWILRRFVDAKLRGEHVPANRSILYRRRAANLAEQADETDDPHQQSELLRTAIQWVQVAENEEYLAQHGTDPTYNDNAPC